MVFVDSQITSWLIDVQVNRDKSQTSPKIDPDVLTDGGKTRDPLTRIQDGNHYPDGQTF